MAWNEKDLEGARTLWYINGFATILSLIGSLFMVWSCLKTPAPRNVSLKLILALATSDLIYSISNIMSQFDDDSVGLFCITEAILRMNGYLLSIYFTTTIAVLCYKTSKHGPAFNQELFFKVAVVIGPIGYFILNLMPFVFTQVAYTNGSLFCFITYTNEVKTVAGKFIVRFIYEAATVILGVFISLLGYIGTVRSLKNLSPGLLEQMKINYYKLFWYPGVMIFVFFPSLIDNLILAYTGEKSSFTIKAMHLFVTHSIGLTNAMIYGFQKRSDRRKAVEYDDEGIRCDSQGNELPVTTSNSSRNSLQETLLQANASDYL